MAEGKGSVAKCFRKTTSSPEYALSIQKRASAMYYWLNGEAAGTRASATACPSCHTAMA